MASKGGLKICEINTIKQYDSAASINECSDGSKELIYNGWTFTSMHKSILSSIELDTLNDRIVTNITSSDSTHHPSINFNLLHLPPMTFDRDILSISNKSSRFSFNSGDALLCWAIQHDVNNISHQKLQVIQVPFAKSWSLRHEKYIRDNSNASNDASATTSVTTSVTPSSPQSMTAIDHSSDKNYIDWTYCNDYCFTWNPNLPNTSDGETSNDTTPHYLRSISDNEAFAVSAYALNASIGVISSRWRKVDNSGIDTNMLRATNVPILFYDETILYQDDLEDCGDVSCNVKIRVMPTCWFVLNRMFLRVDGSIIRIRDTRLFHAFNTNSVYMDITWREDTSLLMDLSTVLNNQNFLAENISIVNCKEGIAMSYVFDMI